MKDLDTLLREDARETIADAGFSTRVLGTLPAPRRRAAWVTPAMVLGSAAVGSLLAIAFAPQGFSIAQGFLDVVQMRGFTPAAVGAMALGAALTGSAVLLAADA